MTAIVFIRRRDYLKSIGTQRGNQHDLDVTFAHEHAGLVQPLEAPDSHHFKAAQGWLELGAATDARTELDAISATNQAHPGVLELRWLVYTEEKQWDEALVVAEIIVSSCPDEPSGWLHHAYALRRATSGGLEKALAMLLPAAEKFPNEPVIPFNLACYTCQMGRMDEARAWLKRAFQVGGKKRIKQMAQADADLKPLWDEIAQL